MKLLIRKCVIFFVFLSSLSEFLAEQGNTFHDAFLTDQVMVMGKMTIAVILTLTMTAMATVTLK